MGVKFSQPLKPKGQTDYTDHLTVVGKQAKVKTVIQKPGAVDKSTEEVLATPKIPPDKLANLNLTIGRTYSTAPYESVKVSVSLTFPSHVDEINETYEFIELWLDKKMQAIETEIKGGQ